MQVKAPADPPRKPVRRRRKPTRTAQRRKADELFSKLVRSRGKCEAAGFDGVWCGGVYQCGHIVRRFPYLSVRWDLGNATCLCAAHHVYFTHHYLAEERFHRQYLGGRGLAALKRRAETSNGAPDYDAIIGRLERAGEYVGTWR